jgi:preprotein translocase subunit SecD
VTVAFAIVGALALGYQLWTSVTPLLAAVRFEVRLAEDKPAPGLVVAQVGDSARLIYLHPEIVVTNDDIAQSWVFQDVGASFGVAVTFLPSGAERMQQATTAHIGRPLAILIDGQVVSVPTIRAPVSDSAVLNGIFTQAEAKRIADGIGRP